MLSWPIDVRSRFPVLLALALAAVAGCDKKVSCPAGQVDCSGVCVDTRTDAGNCGACGLRCARGAACDAGSCGCPSGTTVCGLACVATQTDARNCGACEHDCGLGTCSSGACVCGAATDCGAGANPQCVDDRSDPANCGACGQSCGAGTCATGACACGTSTDCGAGANPRCLDTRTDRDHCGSCVSACGPDQICQAPGNCVTCAGITPDRCGNACVDLQSNASNCGVCGHACTGGKVCSAGACLCPTGRTDCSGTCADLQTDEAHCGSCTKVCGSTQSCSAGACTCASPALTCGPTCCEGTACCASGAACQTKHGNGAGGFYFDCNALGTYTLDAAKAAAASWNAAGSDTTGISLCPLECFSWTTQNPAATGVWCYQGAAQGRVLVNASAVPVCPAAGPVQWN